MALLNIGVNSLDLDELNRIRKVFTDEQVVDDYKHYLFDRS
jgi:hypothetical protein